MLKSDLVEEIEDRDIQLEQANNEIEYWADESSTRDVIIEELKEQLIEIPVTHSMYQQMELEELLRSFKIKHQL